VGQGIKRRVGNFPYSPFLLPASVLSPGKHRGPPPPRAAEGLVVVNIEKPQNPRKGSNAINPLKNNGLQENITTKSTAREKSHKFNQNNIIQPYQVDPFDLWAAEHPEQVTPEIVALFGRRLDDRTRRAIARKGVLK
jgi:hypothetical protein